MKRLIKKYAGMMMGGGFMYELLRSAGRKQLLIIYYHRVANAADMTWIREKNMCVETGQFDAQMRFLSEKFAPVGETAIIDAMEGRSELPDNAVWVTFDDGFKDSYLNAFPILDRYGIPATFFITTGFVNRRTLCADDYVSYALKTIGEGEVTLGEHPSAVTCTFSDEPTRLDAALKLWEWAYTVHGHNSECLDRLVESFGIPVGDVEGVFMDWPDVQKMCDSGQFIGAHTVNHNLLSTLTEAEIMEEVRSSKSEIEARIGRSVNSFAYPHGKKPDFDLDKCAPIFRECGLKLSVTTIGGYNDPKSTDNMYSLKRVGVSHDDCIEAFKFKVGAGSFWQS